MTTLRLLLWRVRYIFVRALPRDDPATLQASPFETFLLTWIGMASVPSVLTGDPGSASVEQVMGATSTYLWAWTCLVGCIITMLGIFWRVRWDGLVIERSGLILVFMQAIIYIYAVKEAAAEVSDVRYIIAVQAGFALAALWRMHQINRRLKWVRQRIADAG